MGDKTQADVIDGVITQSVMGYQKASFKLKKGTEVAIDDAITITEDYTDHNGTSSEVIFDGFIEKYSLSDIKDVETGSKQDEVVKIQPFGYFQGLTTERIDRMVELYADYISTGYATQTRNYYFKAPYNFVTQTGNTNNDIDFISSIEDGLTAVVHAELDDGQGNTYSIHTKCLKVSMDGTTNDSEFKHIFTPSDTGTFDMWFYAADYDVTTYFYFLNSAGAEVTLILLYSDDISYTDGSGRSMLKTGLTDGMWYRLSIKFNGDNTADYHLWDSDGTSIADHNNQPLKTGTSNYTVYEMQVFDSLCDYDLYLDAIGADWEGGYIALDNADIITYNLPVTTNLANPNFSGGQSLQSIMTEGAMLEMYMWALAPDGDIRWQDGSDDSGIILDGTQDVWDVTANAQTKRINRVILKGAAGLEAMAEDTDIQAASGQIVIYKDYRADITNQSVLDALATSILTVQKVPPLRVLLSLRWEAKGWIQVGETIHIEENVIKYNNSSSYIPHNDYIIVSETYHMKNGAYHYIELTLEDGLQYIKQADSDKIDQNTQNANYGTSGGIITGGGGGGIQSLSEDARPQLGGNLDLNGKTIVDGPGAVTIDDTLDMANHTISDILNIQFHDGGNAIDIFRNENDMTSNDEHAGATQSSIKAFVDTEVATKDSKEVSHAYVEATALTLENDLNMGTHKITAVVDPVGDQDAATKKYHNDNKTVAGDLNLNDLAEKNHISLANVTANQHHNEAHTHDGGTLQNDAIASNVAGGFTLSAANVIELKPTNDNDNYISFITVSNVPKMIFTGTNEGEIENLADPTADQDAATKKFVDDHNWLEVDITDLDKYTQAEVLALTWTEADILDLDKYTQAQVDGLLHPQAHTIVSHSDTTATGAELETLTDGSETALHIHDGRYYTETEIGNKIFEQSAAFPGGPSEGDLHYDEDLDSLYRYNGEAEAWVEVGVGGLVAEAVDNLGNHTATQDLAMAGFAITGVGDVDGVDISAHRHDGHTLNLDEINSNGGAFDFKTSGVLNLKASGYNNDYIRIWTSVAQIPHICGIGHESIYFYDGSNWNTLHADDFTPHSSPLPIESSTEKLLRIRNNEDNTKLDYSTIPIDTLYRDKNNENEGYKMSRMMLHLIKTIQELETRIKELEGK